MCGFHHEYEAVKMVSGSEQMASRCCCGAEIGVCMCVYVRARVFCPSVFVPDRRECGVNGSADKYCRCLCLQMCEQISVNLQSPCYYGPLV